MTHLWFNRFAFALLLLAILVNQSRPSVSRISTPEPPSQIIELMKKTGLTYLNESGFSDHEALLAFSAQACEKPVTILYLPHSYPPVSARARALIAEAEGQRRIIHSGKEVGNGKLWDLVPRLLWSQLLFAFHSKTAEAWNQLVLILFVPPNCEAPTIEWSKLTRSQ